jgi:hypothetical protein
MPNRRSTRDVPGAEPRPAVVHLLVAGLPSETNREEARRGTALGDERFDDHCGTRGRAPKGGPLCRLLVLYGHRERPRVDREERGELLHKAYGLGPERGRAGLEEALRRQEHRRHFQVE